MMSIRKSVAAAACALAFGAAASAQTAGGGAYEPTVGQSGKDVIWVPTNQGLVNSMLALGKVTPEDYLVDLGSGDGRTVITAAQRGTRAHGIEFNGDLVALSQQAAKREGVADRATFEQADIFKTDFSKATVVTLFLLSDLNLRLRPTLLEMKPGTRVVSNSFTMDDWEPDDSVRVSEGCSSFCNAFLWIVPAKVEGNWSLGGKPLVLEQKFQKFGGRLGQGDNALALSNTRLDGARISFDVGSERYTGQVDGKTMSGKTASGASWQAARM
ncbi:SAM-dependent methyltransferase [Bordetella genomosp. 1]|uniref:SAM-dependent methyltransferase n=1 Tax=Bordetella genomosp. 1 TaxID=1395607 RepID=A0ABX4F2G5_9BORD|nr:class I SAM-dependent methyltransferase [Bordetella genomosp. 1]OZI67953.1 SAM-dependent methyltransferase [Bordetella genomosp. 1]